MELAQVCAPSNSTLDGISRLKGIETNVCLVRSQPFSTLDGISRLKGIETNYFIVSIGFPPKGFGWYFPLEGN